jgi:hypothetical protein
MEGGNKLSLPARRQAGTWNNIITTVQDVAALQANAREPLASASGYDAREAFASLSASEWRTLN